MSFVEYVEEETYAYKSQSCSLSWGVDRLDQVSPALDCRYSTTNKGAGSDIYILDTGTVYISAMMYYTDTHV